MFEERLNETLRSLEKVKKFNAIMDDPSNGLTQKNPDNVEHFCKKVIEKKVKETGFDIRYVGSEEKFKSLLKDLRKERIKVGSLSKRVQVVVKIDHSTHVVKIDHSAHYVAFDFLIKKDGIKACVIDSLSASWLPNYLFWLEQCEIPYYCSFTAFQASMHGCYIFALSFAFCMAKIEELHTLFALTSKATAKNKKYINEIKKGITLKYNNAKKKEPELTELNLVHPISLYPELVKNAQSLEFLKDYVSRHWGRGMFTDKELKKLKLYFEKHKKEEAISVKGVILSREINTALLKHKSPKYLKRIGT